MPPKRKPDPKQHSLEEVAERPATTKRSKKGDLAHPKVEEGVDTAEDLRRAKLARKHQGGDQMCCHTGFLPDRFPSRSFI